MNKTIKRALMISAAVALALSIPSFERIASAAKDNALFDDPIAAKGKGFEIKSSEIEEAFILYKANLAALGTRIPEDDRSGLEAKLLDELILTRILLEKAVSADKSKARETSGKLINEVKNRASSEDIFKLRLKALGLTPEKFENQAYEQELRKEVLRRELGTKFTISNEQIKQFYETNSADFETPERVRASHILISTLDSATRQPLSDDKKKEKLEQIKKLKERAEKGDDFAALAKEFSEDPGSRDKGGEYSFGRGEMVKPFEEAAFALAPGKISDIIETRFGFHIIKLIEKNPAKKESLAEASPRIKTYLLDKQIRDYMPDFYEQLKKEQDVKILDEKLAAAGKK